MFDYLESFVTLMEQQPELFTADDLQDLMQKVPNWSDDKDDLEDAIVKWLEARPRINEALTSPATKAKKRLGGDAQKAPPIPEEDWKPFLLNTIHRCSPTTAGKNTGNKNISSSKTIAK